MSAGVLCLALGLLAQTGGADVSVVVDPPLGEVGLVMTVVLTVAGPHGADCDLVEVPDPDGGRLDLVSGPTTQQSTIIVNGRLSRSVKTSWRFRLVPERAGRLALGPFRLQCRGEELLSPLHMLRVAGGGLPAGTVGLSLTAEGNELWVGQVFVLRVEASLDEEAAQSLVQNSMELHLPWVEEREGLLLLEGPVPGGDVAQVRLSGRNQVLTLGLSREQRDGRSRLVLRRTLRLLATRAGTVELPQARFSAQIATEVRQDRDPFDLFFGNRRMVASRSVAVDAWAAGPLLTVREPPLEGRPPSFTNAVGSFRLSGVATPTRLRVGDTCTLRLMLSGQGNLEFVRWPEFEQLQDSFRIFRKEEDGDDRSRTLVLDISPRHERVEQVPRLGLAAFDPEQGAYEMLWVGPFALEVGPGGDGGLTTLATPQEILHDLQTIREDLPQPAPPAWPGWVLWLPAGVLLALVEARAQLLRWREKNPRAVARRAARRRLEQALGEARDAGDVAGAFSRYLSAQLAGPPSGMSAQAAAEALPDPQLAADLRRVVTAWEDAYLGGGSVELADALRQARELSGRLEALR